MSVVDQAKLCHFLMNSLFISTGVILLASLLILSSISSHLFILNVVWILLGVLAVLVLWFFDWRVVFRHPSILYALYCVSLLLLIFVLVKGPLIRNAKSWIVLGPVSFQPVE